MSEARINRISNELGTGGPVISGITTFSNVNYFVPPRGTTAERPSNCPSGSIRFNTDGAHLEYFDGLQWLEMEAFNNELGVNGALGNRGVFAGGYTPGATNVIDYITISTAGNSIDFGDITTNYRSSGQLSSSTRGIIAGGFTVPSAANRSDIEFITISSTGNSTDSTFDLSVARHNLASLSSATRGIFIGGIGSPGSVNVIDYITIATIGNAQDFGDIRASADQGLSACASSTRGIYGGGVSNTNLIEYITIATLGNANDFGDLTVSPSSSKGCCSNATRGIWGGGTSLNTIEFVTIVSTGNSTDFGDLTQSRSGLSACASSTRGVFEGGNTPTNVNTIDYVTILTTGNAVDFGDLTVARSFAFGAMSNGHGGL
jgi:hypothetical protein